MIVIKLPTYGIGILTLLAMSGTVALLFFGQQRLRSKDAKKVQQAKCMSVSTAPSCSGAKRASNSYELIHTKSVRGSIFPITELCPDPNLRRESSEIETDQFASDLQDVNCLHPVRLPETRSCSSSGQRRRSLTIHPDVVEALLLTICFGAFLLCLFFLPEKSSK
ncbi:hypothetical protein O6H91_10G038100 [Diphasiastrum complanatum]|uniref:Uncharacterized protein n=1 Tax=Diphasiastrum complanatum TaxID=34168 RepID=A0ACC2CG35_DIPCM|nr:hypothetical protein O6H91_10G038100 [Diphasiastrum complanatum]